MTFCGHSYTICYEKYYSYVTNKSLWIFSSPDLRVLVSELKYLGHASDSSIVAIRLDGTKLICFIYHHQRGSFCIVCLSVWNHISAPIGQIWCNIGINDWYHGEAHYSARICLSFWNIKPQSQCLDLTLLNINDLSRGMRFPTMLHFDMCRLGWASAASF